MLSITIIIHPMQWLLTLPFLILCQNCNENHFAPLLGMVRSHCTDWMYDNYNEQHLAPP